jgi:hypothetical protein
MHVSCLHCARNSPSRSLHLCLPHRARVTRSRQEVVSMESPPHVESEDPAKPRRQATLTSLLTAPRRVFGHHIGTFRNSATRVPKSRDLEAPPKAPPMIKCPVFGCVKMLSHACNLQNHMSAKHPGTSLVWFLVEMVCRVRLQRCTKR